MRLVCNTSPLVALAKANMLTIMPKLAKEILVPQAVLNEIRAGPENDPCRKAVDELPWLSVIKLEPPVSVAAAVQLGSGEAEVIEHTRRNPDYTAVIDDKAARRAAKVLGVKLIGTLGLIALAVRIGLIPSFPDAVGRLRNAGFYVDETTVETITLKMTGGNV